MKLVAIQTPHYAFNYGAQLQAFALSSAIRKMGYNTIFINRRLPYFCEYSNCIDKWLKNMELHTRGKHFVEFEQSFLQPQTKIITNTKQYEQIDLSLFDAIVVGSDQIWRDDYFCDLKYNTFLDFAEDYDGKKISYAASFGKSTCCHPEQVLNKISSLLNRFTAISVREKSGVEILRKTFGVTGEWVLDPTLLHDCDFYCETFDLKKSGEGSNVVSYILGNGAEKGKKIKEIGWLLDLSVDNIYSKSQCALMYKRPLNKLMLYKVVPSVIEWLTKIHNAKYVLTDSFHGMVFCILFRKQFVVFNNKLGGSERFYSILCKLGIRDRLMEWSDDSTKVVEKLEQPIDYKSVEHLLNEFRKASYDFLINAL